MKLVHGTKCYHAELKWRDEHYVPSDVGEHLQISWLCKPWTLSSFHWELWVLGRQLSVLSPIQKLLEVSVLTRISNDIASQEVYISKPDSPYIIKLKN